MNIPTAVDRSAPVIAHHEVDIQAPLDTVWRLHTDINAWQTDISAAHLDGVLEPGASFDSPSQGPDHRPESSGPVELDLLVPPTVSHAATGGG
jgi:hypothetical protein